MSSFLLLSLGVLGWAAENRYHVIALLVHRADAPPAVDPRVEPFLTDGERALSEGNLDLAQGDFDRASVLAGRDPRTLVDEARVGAAKADVPWLKLLLLAQPPLPPVGTEEVRVTKAELNERVAVASQAADAALAAAPQDPRALLAKLDALRLAGEGETARGYVVAVFAQASQAETAYALAALDLGQPATPWATIVDWLRLAAAGGNAGRARAALVYALAKSGDVAGAKIELAKLDAQARLYPLLPDLQAWLARDRTAPPAGPPAGLAAPPPPPSEADPPAPASPATSSAAPAAPPGESVRIAGPSTLQAAAEAMRRGDLDRAERIYQGLVAMHPGDSQALSGLGDVLRQRNDPWGAIEVYQRAITINPSYLPAQLGLADTQWSRGDKAAAAQSYKRIVDHFPDGMYPDYVNQRVGP